MTIDKKHYLHDFREEAEEYFAKLNKNLLLLSSNPEQADDCFQHLKREAHNLKGSSRMLGLNEIEAITHNVEFILEALIDKKLIVSNLVINSLFNCFDLLQVLVERASREEKIEFDLAGVCANLEKIAKNEPGMEFFPAELKRIVEEFRKEKSQAGATGGTSSEEPNGESGKKETLKIKSAKVEELLGLVGEIIVDKIKNEELLNELRVLLLQLKEYSKLSRTVAKEYERDELAISSSGKFADLVEKIEKIEKRLKNYYKEDSNTLNHMSLLINKLQENVFRLRMLPISVLFETFPRAIYDLAQHFNRKIHLEIKGKETEFDKKIVEMMKEPLMHILRNAVDHGIEPEEKRKELHKTAEGSIVAGAWQEGDYVFISVEDDGAGIDPKVIRETAINKKIITQEEGQELSERELMYLVFRQGFSTSETITEVSGRGVGLDVVREKVEDLKGEVNLESKVGQGTRITIKLPLTLSSTSVLLFKCGERTFALPTANIEEIVRIGQREVKFVDGGPVAVLNRRIVPLIHLKDVLNLPSDDPGRAKEKDKYIIVVIAYGRQRRGFIIDALISEQKVVIKSLGEFVRKIRHVAGATILGNGDVVLLLHVPDLMRLINRGAEWNLMAKESKKNETAVLPPKKKILVVEDSLITREMEKNILETANFEVIESNNGVEALEKLALHKIQLIITDVQMPEMDGWQLVTELKRRKEYKNIPVIIVTSLEKTEDKKRGLELGVNAYVVKSDFDQGKLIAMVETFTG